MDRVAVLVDAGYLFAAGSAALTGSAKPRADLVLDPAGVVKALKSVAFEKANGRELLRIYWYDGVLEGRERTTDHVLLANTDDVKIRLGIVNRQGQQKGVDSLIVTDLIELARNQSIADAVLLSGDEDVRISVQIAQNYGVRIHLLGIYPAGGSQSNLLRQEADTITEWSAETVSSFLSPRERAGTETERHESPTMTPAISPAPAETVSSDLGEIEAAVQDFVDQVSHAEIGRILDYRRSAGGIPQEFDRRMLAICGKRIGRWLELGEIRQMRRYFLQRVTTRSG